MKKVLSIVPLLLCAAAATSPAQTVQSYRFQESLFPTGAGPALSEVLACGAVTAPFADQIVATIEGQCGPGTTKVRSFNAGGGFSHMNGFVAGTYTIDIFFKFNALGHYRRIIDFKNGTTDNGLYIYGNCLSFYPNGSSATCPFQPNTYYLITLVRNGATNRVDVYVNGSIFVSGYNDAGGLYAPATTGTPIVLFRDNISSTHQCEDSDGAIRYFSLSNTTSTAAEVALTYSNICAIALSQQHVDFSARVQDGKGLLHWQTVGKDGGIVRFEVQHSTDGESWQSIGTVGSNGGTDAAYSFTDPRMVAGTNYYRLRTQKHDGSASFSNTITLVVDKQTRGWTLTANPASAAIELLQTGAVNEAEISLYALQGQRVWQGSCTSGRVSIPASGLPAGTYVVVCRSVQGQETLRVTVKH